MEKLFKMKYVLLTLLSVLILFTYAINCNEKADLIYMRDESYLNNFYFEDNQVVFDCTIQIKNNTQKSIFFYMDADMSKDKALVLDSIATGYNKNSRKNIFNIEANETKKFEVEFKTSRGDIEEKSDRLPPEKVIIKLITGV